MTDPTKQLSRSRDIAAKVAQVFQARAKLAQERFSERVGTACKRGGLGACAALSGLSVVSHAKGRSSRFRLEVFLGSRRYALLHEGGAFDRV